MNDLLRRAADIMEQRGKATGALVCEDGSCCALGAIGLAGEVDFDHIFGYADIVRDPRCHAAVFKVWRALDEDDLVWAGDSRSGFTLNELAVDALTFYSDTNPQSTVVDYLRAVADGDA